MSVYFALRPRLERPSHRQQAYIALYFFHQFALFSSDINLIPRKALKSQDLLATKRPASITIARIFWLLSFLKFALGTFTCNVLQEFTN